MPMTSHQIAEAFSRHDFASTYPHIANEVTWNLVGQDGLRGKAAVVSACDASMAYLRDVTTTFHTFRTISQGDSVVVDTAADYVEASGGVSRVASCDIYDFVDGMLRVITSYTFELPSEQTREESDAGHPDNG